LASSPQYANQAFRWDKAVYGVQFQVEVTESTATEWATVPAYIEALEAVRGPRALETLLADFDRCASEIQRLARRLFERWFALAVQQPCGAAKPSGRS
jgi:GMP synthase-like glutamine amidotransferase